MFHKTMFATCLVVAATLGAAPATAQIAVGETGLTVNASAGIASDYLFRGISQTRSRMAYQGTGEVSHSSGVYIGAFASNVRYAGTDARQEIDFLAGYRFTLAQINFDVGAVWYTYPGYSRQPGTFGLNYAEGVLKATREIGPVILSGVLAGSPNFFGSSGTGIYLEGGLDWRTGFQDIVLGGRVAHQFVQRNPRFGTPDYTWWGLTASRDFVVERVGTISASVGYYQTSIDRRDCAPINGRGQDICGARAFGSLTFKF
ncbi:MAG: hypothetical protein H7345_03940 [Rubritepida sp.]|nr:hypothetical protein [Rubritepida sp.]